jgi:hypothetical protein
LDQLPFDQARALAATLSYDDLFRNNETHVGKSVGFVGQVLQVIDGGEGKYQLRVNVTNSGFFWTDTVFVRYSGSRLLENDIIEFVGVVRGLLTYDAILGNKVTIPDVEAVNTRLVAKGAATPTPVPTPTPTASPSPSPTPMIGMSRTRPASVGERLIVGNKGREVAVTILEIRRGLPAWELIRSASSYNEPPASGFEYLLLRVRVEYLKAPNPDDKILAAYVDWDAVSSDGTVYKRPSVFRPKPEIFTELYQGGQAEGWAAVQARIEDAAPLIRYEGYAIAWFKSR